ncbi:MAG: DUF6127 family protein [Erythrobacter sp.]|uniref:DUF6127 family protein n=1 Tax=Erythrobacter sp. TaxID=1042 RepID=UPI003264932E
MNPTDTLASLMAQANRGGADIVTLRAIVEETTEVASDRVLERFGLTDPNAVNDLDELRELLQAWRDAKASAWKALIEWAIRGLLAALLIGIAVRLGVWEIL